jgi:flagellar motor switch protein FliN/FliY
VEHPGDAWGPILAAAAAEAGTAPLQYVGPAEAAAGMEPTACLAGAGGALLWAGAEDPALAEGLPAWLEGCAAALGIAEPAAAQAVPLPADAVALAFQTEAGAAATLWMAPGVLAAPEPSSPEFPALAAGEAAPGGAGIDLLLEVPMVLTVELGRAERQIRDVLGLTPGSIVELDRLAGEPVDLLVNGHLIAHAEVVVVDENFGVRITDIVSPSERISRMQGRT